MEKTTVREDNELIERFYVEQGGKPSLPADIWFYESDWNMLMAVVEKIYRFEGVMFTLKNSRAVIKIGKKTFSCHTISALNSTYRVVTEFIRWYNTTKGGIKPTN